MGFPDPAKTTGTEAEIMAAFRLVRDALRTELIPLLREKAKARRGSLNPGRPAAGFNRVRGLHG